MQRSSSAESKYILLFLVRAPQTDFLGEDIWINKSCLCWSLILLLCSYSESWATTAFTNPLFFPSSSAQSLRVTPTYWSSLGTFCLSAVFFSFSPKRKMTRGHFSEEIKEDSVSVTIHSLFFQNNKNSLTNKDFFILSNSTRIYSWRWNKRPVMSVSSPLGSVPTPILPLHPRQTWQESTRAYCCVLDEVYRLFDDWWHTTRKRTSLLTVAFLVELLPFVQNCTAARPVPVDGR